MARPRILILLVYSMIMILVATGCAALIDYCGPYATPGTQLMLREVMRDKNLVEYELKATGVPKGTKFTQERPRMFPGPGTYEADESGILVGGKVLAGAQTFARGEPLVIVFISEDQKIRLCGTATPRGLF